MMPTASNLSYLLQNLQRHHIIAPKDNPVIHALFPRHVQIPSEPSLSAETGDVVQLEGGGERVYFGERADEAQMRAGHEGDAAVEECVHVGVKSGLKVTNRTLSTDALMDYQILIFDCFWFISLMRSESRDFNETKTSLTLQI